jgi:hypothetical protein
MLFAPDRITRDPDRQRRNARTGLGIGLPLALVLIVAANSLWSSFESAFLAGCIGFCSVPSRFGSGSRRAPEPGSDGLKRLNRDP